MRELKDLESEGERSTSFERVSQDVYELIYKRVSDIL